MTCPWVWSGGSITFMLTLVSILGGAIMLTCAYGFAAPEGLLRLVRRFSDNSGFAFAVVARVLFGFVLIMAAPVSRLPSFMYAIGGIALLAAVVLLLLGPAGYRKLIERVAAVPASWLRVWLVFGVAFGAALVWASGLAP